MTNLEGTVALVTGASSGIGYATAVDLAGRGATVVAAARRTDRLEELASTSDRIVALTVDVTDRAAAQAAVEQVVADHGRLDVVVNNAGVMLLGPAVGADLEQWERMVSLNLLGLMYVSHAALPHLLAAAEDGPRQVADLVNVSSVAGRVARAGSGVYNLTKHGVGAFSESLRQEVTKRHVRVSLIEPGAVATELASHNTEAVQATMRQTFGGIELMEAEDIAEIIGFTVSRPRRVAINEVLVRPTEQER